MNEANQNFCCASFSFLPQFSVSIVCVFFFSLLCFCFLVNTRDASTLLDVIVFLNGYREPACLTHFTSDKHTLEFRINKIYGAYDDHWSTWNSHGRNSVYVYCDWRNQVWRDTFYIIDGNLNWITGRIDRFNHESNKQRNEQTKHFEANPMETGKIFWNRESYLRNFLLKLH